MDNAQAIVYGDNALRAVALAATPVGTTNDGVAVFAGVDENEGFGLVTDWVTRSAVATEAANGTSWTIIRRGIYKVDFSVQVAAAVAVRGGINVAGTAAQLLSANPASLADAQTRDVSVAILPAATGAMLRLSATVGIPQSVADAGTGIIRVLLNDNAGGDLPGASVVVAQAHIAIRRINDLNSRS
jgi:hypothetical protein